MSSTHAHIDDAVVIGGGLIGCSIALRLAQAGLRVSVFERGEPGSEASSAGAGMIAPQGESTQLDSYYELCAASRDLYPEFAAAIEDLSGERVGFCRDGTLVAALDDAEAIELDRVYESQKAAGLAVERLTGDQARRHAPALSGAVQSALLMPNDVRVDNEKLMAALALACRKAGVAFHLQSTVTGFSSRNGRVEALHVREDQVESHHAAGVFVLAAGAWSAALARSLGMALPVTPCRGQLVEFEGLECPLVLRAGHSYLVPRSGRRLIAGSTMEYAGFEKAVTGEGLRSVLEGAVRIVPSVGKLQFRRAWAGLRPDTADHLPILGYGDLENLVYATGHFRNGILLTPITAKMISQLIVGGRPVAQLARYAPGRFQTSVRVTGTG